MAATTAKAFDEFKAKLELTSTQKQGVTSRRDATAGYLKQAFPSTSDLPLSRTKLIGSASRGTIIRPIEDIDLLAVFENRNNIFDSYRYDSQTFLYRIRDGLKSYSSVKVVGARGQAVRFFYKDAPHVDVAPVFKWSGDGYGLPNGQGRWLTTDPDAHEAYFDRRNRELDYRLKPLVRMIKQWNRAHSKYLKSFHLEVMVSKAFNSLGGDSRNACEIFFGWAINNVTVYDPAGHGGDLSSYLTPTSRSNLITNLRTAHQRSQDANVAESAGDHAEAIRLWRIVFGSEFPAYG
ncbi:MAG: hypothetical protein WB565_01635 [Acidimicrobiales bacterium]